MKHLTSPNRWSCLPTSLAMLANLELDTLLEKVGHDGSEKIFPDLDEPLCRRAFCIEELQYITPTFGFVLVPYSAGILYRLDKDHLKEIHFEKLTDIMMEREGLLFGTPMGKRLGHVVAWSNRERMIYDPNGTKYPAEFGHFVIETFYGKYDIK